MGLFNRNKEGGIMDAIRCDEKDFLIWKWRPAGQAANSTKKENVIRSGSSLSVRPGQAAVFLYQNTSGEYDIIKGPYNGTLKTENLPVLASIVGAAFAGGSPYPAEVYYFNLAKNMEIPFTIPYFRVVPAEPEFKTYDVEVALKGTVAFEVSSQPEYIKYLFEAWGGSDTTLEELNQKMKTLVTQEIKQIVTNAPKDTGIFVMHLNSLIGELGQYILARIQQSIANRFGVLATSVLLSEIRYDEESESYQRIKYVTEDQAHKFNLENEKNALLAYEIQRQTMQVDANVRNRMVQREADIQLEHQADMLSRMRQEAQYAQHVQTQSAAIQANLGSQSANLDAHSINRQSEVLKEGMQNMGKMSGMNLGSGQMNPVGMMTGMAMGASVAGQMGNMMNKMGEAIPTPPSAPQQGPQATPPPIPNQTPSYFVALNGQQFGPYDLAALKQLVQSGQINAQTPAWTEGMPSWVEMGSIPQLSILFAPPVTTSTPPPIPR